MQGTLALQFPTADPFGWDKQTSSPLTYPADASSVTGMSCLCYTQGGQAGTLSLPLLLFPGAKGGTPSVGLYCFALDTGASPLLSQDSLL